MTTLIAAAAIAWALIVAAYFVMWNVSQLAMLPAAATVLWRHRRRYTGRARALIGHISAPPEVSIIVPAYNEALTIVDSLRALLALDYESFEIVIVNDGSKDNTLEVLQQTFQLIPAPVAFEQPLQTAAPRGLYRSISDTRIVVLDKENGGCKADASNAGINAASGTLVLVIDADTVIEKDSLARAVLPFLEDPSTLAVGCTIALTNGCQIDLGRVSVVGMPRNWLARFQVIEYMRAFLLFRLACAARNGVVLISGAFGLFRRDAVIAVGGFDKTAIGEDMDLTLRLQEYYRRRHLPFQIAFDPNPLGWTQAPEDLRSLKSQRCRWRRGLMQVLWRHRRMIGNPRYGVVGLGVLPYVAFFEGAAPLLELTGYLITFGAALAGLINWQYFWLVMLASILFGTAVTLVAMFMSDMATGRYTTGRELMLLLAIVLVENFGYRQLNAWWGCVGTAQSLTGKGGWGVMKRQSFKSA
jgi:cellulose synthase/poly-beta-1,6-N-acetylglucosamine synthase-like glycosyltransferase